MANLYEKSHIIRHLAFISAIVYEKSYRIQASAPRAAPSARQGATCWQSTTDMQVVDASTQRVHR